MIDLLLDLTFFPSYQTVYYTFLVGLVLKYLWDWNIKTTVQQEFFATDQRLSLDVSITTINMNVQKYNTPILHWIVKNIRKRIESSHDDPEKPITSFVS
ncbi:MULTISPECIES: hypothetical protein [Niallia]|jgi:hypothetical protein|uniref:Uncharacterized protein n=1 Tax=Niallia circulans TaxID=1397 RepID=A0A268FHT4_NIACI|nr:hypothetical protein [Niallia circulans]AYV66440.1 hypothetical protein C2I06_05870 [Niallia circulans]AYV70742.1 hypothetical protein C2H98_03715 [Niallia circulans]NRG26760.1 hypothetical protein [Niallia circulans]PAD84918.1 hypothetical protein CHH57_02490 [Niallia circulans]QJX62331.1 hypothetical protein HLK66_12160 [Niallia circulans]